MLRMISRCTGIHFATIMLVKGVGEETKKEKYVSIVKVVTPKRAVRFCHGYYGLVVDVSFPQTHSQPDRVQSHTCAFTVRPVVSMALKFICLPPEDHSCSIRLPLLELSLDTSLSFFSFFFFAKTDLQPVA